MQRPTRLEIKGLFGSRDIDLPIDGEALILVGPNGIGKSTVANIFYFFISKQWSRLSEYDFSEVAIWFGREEIRAARADITGLSDLMRALDSVPLSSRLYTYIEKLRNADLLEEFVSQRRNPKSREVFSRALGVSDDELRQLYFTLRRRLSAVGSDEDLFFAPRIKIEKQLSAHVPSRTLYLPTYRRIEKDLGEIFPTLEQHVNASARASGSLKLSRSSKHYVDLVSFGMEDVRSNIDAKTRALRDYSLAQFNNLSGLYLRDVIRGTADDYSPAQIAALNEDALGVSLGRVSDQVLSIEDKQLLRTKILEIKGKARSQMEPNDRYLAHYVSRLMSVSADISLQETEILAFIDVCNAYLRPSKKINYDDTNFSVSILDENKRAIDLSFLSSGEKQVVSLFSHLYLDEIRDQIVIIDEPELSLSVPWQKRFLPDILESEHCNFIMSVTHSPFIYQNRLKHCAIDLRRFTKSVKG